MPETRTTKVMVGVFYAVIFVVTAVLIVLGVCVSHWWFVWPAVEAAIFVILGLRAYLRIFARDPYDYADIHSD